MSFASASLARMKLSIGLRGLTFEGPGAGTAGRSIGFKDHCVSFWSFKEDWPGGLSDSAARVWLPTAIAATKKVSKAGFKFREDLGFQNS